MARKSRKDMEQQRTIPYHMVTFRVAMYIRLSVEDKKKRGNSIESQRSIIENHIALNPDFKLFDVYIDNGTTGTTFERDEFKRMLADIEAGKVNCIIVKDLSRLGRNVIDTGYYIEKYFPGNGVRFISVTDNFDSEDKNSVHGGIVLPLKNMINEAYALDISRKIRKQAQASMKAGDYIGARPPYGYVKAPDNCHKLIIDPETAPVVRQIFEWAYEKAGLNTIVKRLNDAGILSPSHDKRKKGLITHENLTGKDKWQTFTVTQILSREIYTGDMVQGKSKTVNHKQISVDEENWIVVHDTHEAIVSREMFEAVRAYREQVSENSVQREKKPYTENIFKGKIFCGCCGGSLHRQRAERKKGPDVYWLHCIANSRIAKGTCQGVMMDETDVQPVVLSSLLRQSEAILGKHLLLQRGDELVSASRSAAKAKITVIEQEIDKNRRFLKSLYENLINELLTDEEYFSMKADYEAKIADAMARIGHLEIEQEKLVEKTAKYHELSSSVNGLSRDRRLTAAIVDKLIDRITIYPDRRVEIAFSFQSEFDGVSEVLKQCANM